MYYLQTTTASETNEEKIALQQELVESKQLVQSLIDEKQSLQEETQSLQDEKQSLQDEKQSLQEKTQSFQVQVLTK